MKAEQVKIELEKVSRELTSMIYPEIRYHPEQSNMMAQVIYNNKQKAETLQRVVLEIISKIED